MSDVIPDVKIYVKEGLIDSIKLEEKQKAIYQQK